MTEKDFAQLARALGKYLSHFYLNGKDAAETKTKGQYEFNKVLDNVVEVFKGYKNFNAIVFSETLEMWTSHYIVH
jgi:hypothetical protein